VGSALTMLVVTVMAVMLLWQYAVIHIIAPSLV
jgi:hypothetical protein